MTTGFRLLVLFSLIPFFLRLYFYPLFAERPAIFFFSNYKKKKNNNKQMQKQDYSRTFFTKSSFEKIVSGVTNIHFCFWLYFISLVHNSNNSIFKNSIIKGSG